MHPRQPCKQAVIIALPSAKAVSFCVKGHTGDYGYHAFLSLHAVRLTWYQCRQCLCADLLSLRFKYAIRSLHHVVNSGESAQRQFCSTLNTWQQDRLPCGRKALHQSVGIHLVRQRPVQQHSTCLFHSRMLYYLTTQSAVKQRQFRGRMPLFLIFYILSERFLVHNIASFFLRNHAVRNVERLTKDCIIAQNYKILVIFIAHASFIFHIPIKMPCSTKKNISSCDR